MNKRNLSHWHFLPFYFVGLVLSLHSARAAFDHSYADWDAWLKKYATVTGPVTTVDYHAAKQDTSSLFKVTNVVTAVTPTEYDAFSETQKLAFLINSYNALTVKLIVDNYPVKSIKDIGSLFTSPWKKKFFKFFGQDFNLDGIEHDTIRKTFNEPRIHFCVVCASKGCPQLRGEAFVAGKIEEQLQAQAVSFVRDTNRNRWDGAEGKYFLSKIFDWYGKDFVKKHGSVQSFLAPILGTTPEEQAAMQKGKLSFLDYDWTLNETTVGSLTKKASAN